MNYKIIPVISSASFQTAEHMLSSQVRSSLTSRGLLSFTTYKGNNSLYEISDINLGNNFISSLEVVSSLNLFNLARWQYYIYKVNCIQKYNPKVYFGTIQSVAQQWNYDDSLGLAGLGQGAQKSGSCCIKKSQSCSYSD